jgi:hypothetical protein
MYARNTASGSRAHLWYHRSATCPPGGEIWNQVVDRVHGWTPANQSTQIPLFLKGEKILTKTLFEITKFLQGINRNSTRSSISFFNFLCRGRHNSEKKQGKEGKSRETARSRLWNKQKQSRHSVKSYTGSQTLKKTVQRKRKCYFFSFRCF